MLLIAWHWIVNLVWGWGGIGAIVAAAAWALWFFCPAFLLTYKSQLLHIAIAATVFTVAYDYAITTGYNNGHQAAINEIAARNQETTDAVKKATSSVDDCNASNGTWDTVTGLCAH